MDDNGDGMMLMGSVLISAALTGGVVIEHAL